MLDMHAVISVLLPLDLLVLEWHLSDQAPVSCYQIRYLLWLLFTALDVVTLHCQVWLIACCMSLALPSFPKPHCVNVYMIFCVSEPCICFSSAPTSHHNAAVPKGLHLWSAGEHCHPLRGQGEASSQVRHPSITLTSCMQHSIIEGQKFIKSWYT